MPPRRRERHHRAAREQRMLRRRALLGSFLRPACILQGTLLLLLVAIRYHAKESGLRGRHLKRI